MKHADYAKPLAGGGHRIIARGSAGRFTRSVLDCKICPKCRIINIPEMVDERVQGGFVTKRYPKNCHDCGAILDAAAERYGEEGKINHDI